MIQDFLLNFKINSICLREQNFSDNYYLLRLKFDKNAYQVELTKNNNIQFKKLTLSLTEPDLRKKLKGPVQIDVMKYDLTSVCGCSIRFPELDVTTNIDGAEFMKNTILNDSQGVIMGKITLCLTIRIDYCKRTCANLDRHSMSSGLVNLYNSTCKEKLNSPPLIANQSFPEMYDSDASCAESSGNFKTKIGGCSEMNNKTPWEKMYERFDDRTCVQLFGSDFESYQNSINTSAFHKQMKDELSCDNNSSTFRTFDVENSKNVCNDNGEILYFLLNIVLRLTLRIL